MIFFRSMQTRSRAARRAFVAAGLLGFGAATIAPASAQYAPPPYALPPWAYPYYHGGYPHYRGDYPPPPGPPGDEGPMTDAPSYYEPHGLTIAEIRRRVSRLGLHLVAKPRRKGDIFLAEAAEPNGTGHRLVFDAEGGKLIENTTLPLRKKRLVSPPPAASAGH
jgi:hypothetical protein